MVLSTEVENKKIKRVLPQYSYIKIDALSYPQFNTIPFVQFYADHYCIISVLQENNF
jgi:hypothetical protein